jgi:hypothetical protein
MQKSYEIKEKWATIKILTVLKEEIEAKVLPRGRFSNVPDFVEFVVRNELDKTKEIAA